MQIARRFWQPEEGASLSRAAASRFAALLVFLAISNATAASIEVASR